MKDILTVFICLLFVSSTLFAQQNETKPTSSQSYLQRYNEIIPKADVPRFGPKITHLESPFPGSDTYRNYLEQLKIEYKQKRSITGQPAFKTDTTISPVVQMKNFNGNPWTGGVPNDNDMAISNDGKLISVVNSNIRVFDTNTDSLLMQMEINDFADTSLNFNNRMFDPRVLYDPNEDKFVMVWLNGSTSTTTSIAVAFSQTNDPSGNWNQYRITGNPQMNTTWTDFPMIGLTEDDFVLSINLIYDDSTWQAGFKETVVWQMDKMAGYSGTSVNTIKHENIFYGGNPIRNLTPAQGGSKLHGPNFYFVSNRNFDMTNDTVFVIELSGNSFSNPTMNVDFVLMDLPYGVPPNARQVGTDDLQTNDGRWLDAYYEDNQIQFVGNTFDPATGFCALYHGIIKDVSGARTTKGHIYGDAQRDFGYPSICYAGQHSPGEQQAMIGFNSTSPMQYAGTATTYFNGLGQYADAVTLYIGDASVNVLGGSVERWGDYSGMQPRYNQDRTFWYAGFYGKRISGFPLRFANQTWISELKAPFDTVIAPPIDTNFVNSEIVFPNPVGSSFNVSFQLAETMDMEFLLYDITGKKVAELLQQTVKKGDNLFTFYTDNLSNGIYVLVGKRGDEVVLEAKVLKD